MLLEGTSKYFWLLFLILFLVYLTAKICLAIIFKRNNTNPWQAFIPFYNKYVLVKLLNKENSLFFKTLIPLANLYYFNLIIKYILESYSLNTKDSTWFLIFPMFKFPEFVLKTANEKMEVDFNESPKQGVVVDNIDVLDMPEETEDNEELPETTMQTLDPNSKMCPKCHEVLDKSVVLCPKCGYLFE